MLERLDTCPICNASQWTPSLSPMDHTVSGNAFQLQECGACGFLVTNPRPGFHEIGKYYASDNYISHTNSKRGLQNSLYQMVRRYALQGKFEILRRHVSHGKVLDIGCGTGQFLEHLTTRGYLVEGVEPDLEARQRAIADHSLKVMPSLDSVPGQEQFHAVTLWHVLEHLHELRKTLKQIHALCANKALVMIAVPDRGSWDAQHYGQDWAAYDVPRHLWHFRKTDIGRLLHEHGFELVETKRMWFDAFYVGLLSERYRGAGPLMAWSKAMAVGVLSCLYALFGGRPTSSTLFIAKKSDA